MRKERLSVYLDPPVMTALRAYADRRDRSMSLVAEAAIASFISPDAAEREEAALIKRLDRLNRQLDRIGRDQTIATEALALFIRSWLQATHPIADHDKTARAKGAERYERFIEALGQRLAATGRLVDEVTSERA